jgi:geranylgeranyl diphosphate synthase type I
MHPRSASTTSTPTAVAPPLVTPLQGTDVTAHPASAGEELVVLLDERGTPCGIAPKAEVHAQETPLHLALSCYVVDHDGRVLLTRRSRRKRTWPGVWTNSCCGHPLPGETIREAAARRVRQELGLHVERVALAFPDFSYRAVMDDGTVENELCPVVVAQVAGELLLDPEEVDDARWVSWQEFEGMARDEHALSPWSIAQARRFSALGTPPAAWLDGRPPHQLPSAVLSWPGLDTPAADRDASVRRGVERVLDQFLAARVDELAEVDPSSAPIGDVVTALVASGGKRLRPAFVYWGHRAAGAGHDDALLTLGAAVELLHTFALVHDDVMDRSETRRGRPAAHAALSELHRTSAWDGDDGWFGMSAAVVAGDLAHVWAQQLFDEAPLSGSARRRARVVFTRLQTEVMAGQYLDLRLAARPLGPNTGDDTASDVIDGARRVALLKSGRYTVTRPLQLGAAVAGSDDALDGVLTRYGDAIGVAFQLRDDVLGLMGDPARTGKSCSDDLREGKRTELVLRTLARSSGEDRTLVVRALGDPHVDDATCERVRAVVTRSGALAEVEQEITRLFDEATAAIRDVAPAARDALLSLARLATQREQ